MAASFTRSFRLNRCKIFSLFIVCSLYSSTSHAVLTDSLTVGSAKALSLGNAVTADPPGIDSIHFNPAGLAALKGRQYQLKVIGAAFNVKLKFGDYVPERKAWMDDMRSKGYLPESWFNDVAHNSVSNTEGAALMLPGLGMTDLPVMIGPMGGFTYNPPGSDATFANSVYTPMAVGFYRADDDPGRFIGKRLSFTLLSYFTPSFAYQFNDEWSFGATLTFNYAGAGIDLPFRSGQTSLGFLAEVQHQTCPSNPSAAICNPDNPNAPTINLYDQEGELIVEAENPMTLGFNAGVLWHPVEWATFGAVYQAPVKMNMKGTFTWDNGASWNAFIAPLMAKTGSYEAANKLLGALGWSLPEGKPHTTGVTKVNMTMPAHYAFGTSLKFTPRTKINIDYKHTNWSEWQSIPVQFSTPIDLLRLAAIIQPQNASDTSATFPLGLKDTWNWSAGFQYDYSDRLAIRFGVEDRPTSIPKEARSPLLPIGSGKLYSTGIGYKVNGGGVLDLAIARFTSKVEIPGGTSTMGNSLNPYLIIYNPFPGTDIKTETSFLLLELGYRTEF